MSGYWATYCTAGLNDITAIPHFKIQITEIPHEKKLNTVSPHFSLHAVEEVIEYLGLKHPIIFDARGGGTPIHYLYGYVPLNGVVILNS